MSDSIKSADRRLKLLLMLQSSKQLSVNKIADYYISAPSRRDHKQH